MDKKSGGFTLVELIVVLGWEYRREYVEVIRTTRCSIKKSRKK